MLSRRKLAGVVSAVLVLSSFSATSVRAEDGASIASGGFFDELYRNISPFYRNISPFYRNISPF